MNTLKVVSVVLVTILVSLLVFACDPVAQDAPREVATERAPAQATSPAVAPAEEAEHEQEGVRPETNDSPFMGQATVGEPVAESVELVNASDILSDPDQYAGRTVRITGQVKAYCAHRRAWFAIDVPGANPPYLRFLTAPAFLVPPGVMDAEVTAVGVVEVEETPQARMRHIEQEHELGSTAGSDAPGRAKRVVIRATGAEFVASQG